MWIDHPFNCVLPFQQSIDPYELVDRLLNFTSTTSRNGCVQSTVDPFVAPLRRSWLFLKARHPHIATYHIRYHSPAIARIYFQFYSLMRSCHWKGIDLLEWILRMQVLFGDLWPQEIGGSESRFSSCRGSFLEDRWLRIEYLIRKRDSFSNGLFSLSWR